MFDPIFKPLRNRKLKDTRQFSQIYFGNIPVQPASARLSLLLFSRLLMNVSLSPLVSLFLSQHSCCYPLSLSSRHTVALFIIFVFVSLFAFTPVFLLYFYRPVSLSPPQLITHVC